MPGIKNHIKRNMRKNQSFENVMFLSKKKKKTIQKILLKLEDPMAR